MTNVLVELVSQIYTIIGMPLVSKGLCRKDCWSSSQTYINNVIGDSFNENPKTFWNFVRLKRTENLGIPPLRKDNRLFTTNQEKANALNTHFKSVFTEEPDSAVPSKGTSPYPSIPSLKIHTAGIANNSRT